MVCNFLCPWCPIRETCPDNEEDALHAVVRANLIRQTYE